MSPLKDLMSFLLSFGLLKSFSISVRLLNTEDGSNIQAYDCIYYTNITAANNETTPYCIRTKESIVVNRSFLIRTCENSGIEWTFKRLKDMNVSQDKLLLWNSSIEMVDKYGTYLRTGHEQFEKEKICQCSPGTFGKFCEYQFLTYNTFEETINYQFHLKKVYRNGSQLWGNITCYTTLSDCFYGLRCLAWQNICDGKQQCMDGIDEDHCEELEYNECEENEYRCQDGSCIAQEYWLDGEYDCSDKSDEQYIFERFLNEEQCPLMSSRFICDEVTAYYQHFACGDGEFVWDVIETDRYCYNYRLIMFFCEFTWGDKTSSNMWTLQNGHCVDNGWLENNFTDMNEIEKCIFYLKCQLTNGKNIECDKAIENFHLLCIGMKINYPTGPFFLPFVQTLYTLNELDYLAQPNNVFFNGSLKCVGYQARFHGDETLVDWMKFKEYYDFVFDDVFCNLSKTIDLSGPQFDKNCWNDKKQSFFCEASHRCISKHRLGDDYTDCRLNEDENSFLNCQVNKKYYFHCPNQPSKCLLIPKIGNGEWDCDNGNDEYLAQLSWILHDHHCTSSNPLECQVLKEYIKSSSSKFTKENNKLIEFRQYCDTLWQLPKGIEESFCNKWKCPKDEYQCISGHCVPIDYALELIDTSWNCPDASDKDGLFRIINISDHNSKIVTDSELQSAKDLLNFVYELDSTLFSSFCDLTKEYGCILAAVDDPLNFTVHRPCIDLMKIGDGTIDCYGGLDERNLLYCGNNTSQQRGFDFHCNDAECIPYHRQCEQRCSNNVDSLLCDKIPTFRNSFCQNLTRSQICSLTFIAKCNLSSIDTFYCDRARAYRKYRSSPYRYKSWNKRKTWIYLPGYPQLEDNVSIDFVQTERSEMNNFSEYVSAEQDTNSEEGWICGRGVAIKRNKIDAVQCFCPPSLYGEYCQYFSDRIAIIISFHKIPQELLEPSINTIKILALLFSDDEIIDYYVFHLPLVIIKDLKKKFRFNLIYRRPKLLTKSYVIRFETYHLTSFSSIKFIAVWEYPIHFPFLPSYRFAQILKFEKENASIGRLHICQTDNPCLYGSTCYPIMNQINNISAYYCYCHTHSFGKNCQNLLLKSISTCSEHALQRTFSFDKSICLCPINLYGPTCYINHTCMYKNPCDHQRGKCYSNPDNMTRDYICVCDKRFFGDHCEFNSAVVRINFSELSFVQFPSNYIMTSIIQLCDLHNETLDLIVREKRVYQNLPPLITEIFHNNHYLPTLGIIKLYQKQQLSNDYVANLKQPSHFILYIAPFKVSRMNITAVLNLTNYCSSTRAAFQTNISNHFYLSQLLTSNEEYTHRIFNTSILIFKYHLLCDAPYSLMCFYDDNYFCVCDQYGHAECLRYDRTLDECVGRCRAGAQCIRGDLDDHKDFICLCPRCYYGSICQHNTELFSFTLETLLTTDLYSTFVEVQTFFSSVLIIIPSILFLIGIGNNICSFLTFNRTKPLLVGIGHYLRAVSIVNQLTLLTLLLKLIHVVLSIKGYIIHPTMNTILCKSLSYCLSCISRMSYWLMGMVAIERVYVTWFLQGTWLKSPRIAKRIIVITITTIVAFNIHEVIFYQSIEDPKNSNVKNSTWCVTSYPLIISKYNQINIVLNYIMPFLINLLATIILMMLIIQKRATVTMKRSDHSIESLDMRSTIRTYISLFQDNKELILAPAVTMLPQFFSLPQFILSFTLACQEFNIHWQRYLLILSYFINYLPQVLSYKLYVSPSSFYTNEFHATTLGQKIVQWQQTIIRKKPEIISISRNKTTKQTLTRAT